MAVEMLKRQVSKKGADHRYSKRAWQDVAEDFYTAMDYNQPVCVNWVKVNGVRTPDCIMGHVYDDLGMLSQVGIGANVYAMLRILAKRDVVMTQRAVSVFHTAQSKQDGGATWGDAVEAAQWHAENCFADDDTRYLTWERLVDPVAL